MSKELSEKFLIGEKGLMVSVEYAGSNAQILREINNVIFEYFESTSKDHRKACLKYIKALSGKLNE